MGQWVAILSTTALAEQGADLVIGYGPQQTFEWFTSGVECLKKSQNLLLVHFVYSEMLHVKNVLSMGSLCLKFHLITIVNECLMCVTFA